MYQKRAPGIMYDELVLTTKTYARGVSGIELAWLRTKVSGCNPRVENEQIVLTAAPFHIAGADHVRCRAE